MAIFQFVMLVYQRVSLPYTISIHIIPSPQHRESLFGKSSSPLAASLDSVEGSFVGSKTHTIPTKQPWKRGQTAYGILQLEDAKKTPQIQVGVN
jgi:hypothetical protein